MNGCWTSWHLGNYTCPAVPAEPVGRKKSRGVRRLTEDQIVDAALQVIRSDRLDALSMRRLSKS